MSGTRPFAVHLHRAGDLPDRWRRREFDDEASARRFVRRTISEDTPGRTNPVDVVRIWRNLDHGERVLHVEHRPVPPKAAL